MSEVEALLNVDAGKVPPGAVNSDRWTRRPG